MRKFQFRKKNAAQVDFFADFPEQPEGMKMRVKRSPNCIELESFHTISSARNKAQKWTYYVLATPFFFLLFAAIIDHLVHDLFFYSPENPTPRWIALAVYVPLWTVVAVIIGFSGVFSVRAISRLSPERKDWSLILFPTMWRVCIKHETIPSGEDSSWELRDVKIAQIAATGVDEEGQVYCEEVTYKYGPDSSRRVSKRVVLTPPLSPVEAAWVEQALRSVLTLAPGSLAN